MARIRTIKPEAFTSRETSAMTDAVFRTFTGLFCYVDDKGRGEDDADLIVAAVAPRIKTKTARVIAGHLAELARGDDAPLCRYEVDGVPYLHLVNFLKHQRINRPTPSKLPGCPKHDPEHLF